MTLQERIIKAMDLRKQGYNCAQAVAMVFPDLTGMDDDMAARLTSALGSGVGGQKEICGAANAMAICAGMRHGSAPQDKASAMQDAGNLCSRFREENGGRINCKDLKGVEGVRPCNDLIAQAITILHESMQDRN